MYKLRSSNERGNTKTDWLDSHHTFSFGDYYDPDYMGFSDLRVINEDTVGPDSGFRMHRHENMEIITIILSGALQHKDSLGNGSTIQAGEVQRVRAGSGIFHSEFNPSSTEPVHFLQIWILPDKKNLSQEYEQKSFNPENKANKLCLIISPDGRDNSIRINQDVEIYQINLESDKKIDFKTTENRKIWFQIAEGSIEVNSQILKAGDGLAIIDEKDSIELKGLDEKSDILIFNLRK